MRLRKVFQSEQHFLRNAFILQHWDQLALKGTLHLGDSLMAMEATDTVMQRIAPGPNGGGFGAGGAFGTPAALRAWTAWPLENINL